MNGIPRRADVQRYTSGETAIGKAIEAVEAMGAHEHLTRAVTLLVEAKDRVADFVDGVEPRVDTFQVIGPCPACKLGSPEVQGKQRTDGTIAFRVLCPTCGRGHDRSFLDDVPAAIAVWHRIPAKPPLGP